LIRIHAHSHTHIHHAYSPSLLFLFNHHTYSLLHIHTMEACKEKSFMKDICNIGLQVVAAERSLLNKEPDVCRPWHSCAH